MRSTLDKFRKYAGLIPSLPTLAEAKDGMGPEEHPDFMISAEECLERASDGPFGLQREAYMRRIGDAVGARPGTTIRHDLPRTSVHAQWHEKAKKALDDGDKAQAVKHLKRAWMAATSHGSEDDVRHYGSEIRKHSKSEETD